ncbi:ABC transporter ATP-binding protein [Mahella sp.]|uniref:ABC transporter ATP-binding protein n=1 Tax=Mahella sp. TaxID=2798721 RepID=UPI0025BD1518|nr:ABC transporter ATP-binding protein [Mahella sp.]MBZ4666651.1 transporter related protein [Mahella sp.]MDK2902635.1 ATP-binding cassette, subfamily multidrug efflux pump [Clostridiales bacterium]
MPDYVDEEISRKSYDPRIMRRLLGYMLPYWAPILSCIVLLFLITAGSLATPYLMKLAIDNYLFEVTAQSVAGITRISIIYLIITAATGIMNYIQIYVLQYTGQRIIYGMRQEIFTHIENMPLGFFDKNPVGRLVTRVTNDTDTINEMYTSVVVNLFRDAFMLIGIAGAMLLLNYKLALVAIAFLPIVIILTILYRKWATEAYRLVRVKLARINAFLSEHIMGMRLIQIFHREQPKQQEFEAIDEEYYDANMKQIKVFAVFRPAMDVIYSLTLAAILWVGGGDVIRNALEFGVLYAFVNYTMQFFQPIYEMAEKYDILQAAMASAERIFMLLDQKSTIEDPPAPLPLDHVKGEVEFKNVWFAYNDEDWVLKDVSFHIEPGQTVALVGHTGAGKTSIINLLSRFYDIQKGQISIDDIDIRNVRQADLRRHIGVVLQDVFLFTGDIKSNIRLNEEGISEQKIKEVASYVNADHFIEKLPKKYDEPVMERGATLSAGQRQLLAFARALAFDPAILVLDEATANIDTETEALIQDALEKLSRGRTTIVIAHRLSTIQHADKIIVLHKGRIREEGTHQQLLAKRGIYYALYQLQYKNMEGKAAVGD